MAIGNIGFNSAASGLLNRPDPSANRQAGRQDAASNASANQPVANNSPVSNSRDGTQVSSSNAVALASANQTNQPNRLASSRRDPAETEAYANQYRLQRESGQGNSAIEQFVSVANFEQRDQLANTTGIDIFV